MSWIELSKDTHMEMGKKYKIATFFERTAGNSSDVMVTTAMQMCMSNAEIEDKIYKDGGVKVKVLNRFGAVEKGGEKYSYNLIVEPVDLTGNPVPIIIYLLWDLAVVLGPWIMGAIITYLITDTFKGVGETAYEEGGAAGGISQNVMLIAIAVVLLTVLLKK